MEKLDIDSLLNNSKPEIKNNNKTNSILAPLNAKEKKIIHNVSTKYNLHNNNSSSVDARINNTNKKNLKRSSITKNYQNENSEDNLNINLNIDELTKKKDAEKEAENENQDNNQKKSLYKIMVAVRCRPLSQKEKEISPKETINIVDKKVIKLKDPNGFLNPNNIRAKEQILEFDHAFDSKDSQETIFNSTTKPLIEGIVNGFNATVFAYGATGAGKTYTMLGDEENPGIMSLTFGELFKKIKTYSNRDYLIKLWYLEIYNENIKDLLINNSPNLELREDPNRGLIVNGITEIITNSSEHILSILKKGNKNRTTEATNANQTSSRSHAILQIMVSYKEKNTINNKIKYGKLSLIDLAGSERASVTKNKGMRLIEGANINKSLLTLGNCINALCESNIKGTKPHVPYRDSKLTRLLKDSLGGNSRTVMIANISPFIYSFDDTYNTLNYADRAKHIKTRVKANVINNKSVVNNYLNVIKHLQDKVSMLQSQLNVKKVDKNDILNINIENLNSKENEKNNSEENNKIHSYFDKKKSQNKSAEKSIQRIITHENNINYINNMNLEKDKLFDKKNIGDIIEENEKIINGIIEEYVQMSKAEIQIKQKVMGIKYDIFNLNNKILKNEMLFPYSLPSSFANCKSEKTKLKSLKRILEKNTSLLSDISTKNENILKKYTENTNEQPAIEMNELQKNYMFLINKNSGIEKENIQIKYDYAIIKIILEKKDNYIKELQKQIDIRDNIIKNKLVEMNDIDDEFDENINIKNLMNPRQKLEYQTLEQLELKFSIVDFRNSNNFTLNKNSSFCSTYNLTSGYQKNKYSFRPRNSSFIQKREVIRKRKFNFDDSNIYLENYLYNDSESNINNSCLHIGAHSLYPYMNKYIRKKDENQSILNISNRKDKFYDSKKKKNNKNNNKNQYNINPISFKNSELDNSNIKNKTGINKYDQNNLNSNVEDNNLEIFENKSKNDEDQNNEDEDENNENINDITLFSMLNDIEAMNCDVMSKLNIIENNSYIKNHNNSNNINNKTNNNSNNNSMLNINNYTNNNSNKNILNNNNNNIISINNYTNKANNNSNDNGISNKTNNNSNNNHIINCNKSKSKCKTNNNSNDNFNMNKINNNSNNNINIDIDINSYANKNNSNNINKSNNIPNKTNNISNNNISISNNSNKINNNNINNNLQIKQNNINTKKNNTSKKKNSKTKTYKNNLIMNDINNNNNNSNNNTYKKTNQNKINKNLNKNNNIKVYDNNLKKLDNKVNTQENSTKNNLITGNTNKKDKYSKNTQIQVNRKKNKNNNQSLCKRFSFIESNNNNNHCSMKKINTNHQKDFLCSSSSTQNLMSNNGKKIKAQKKDRNSSMVNRNIHVIKRNSAIKDKKNLINNYNTNTNESNPTRNINRSMMMPSDGQMNSLDYFIDSSKKNKNKFKNMTNYHNENSINEDNSIDNQNKSNKLQQFYAEHLNKNNNANYLMNKRSSIINNGYNDYSNYINNKSDNSSFEVYKSYDCPDKNIDVINNQKFFDFKMDLKEKIKHYDKINIKQLTKYDVKKNTIKNK